MAQTTFSPANIRKPAPKRWRKFEDGMLTLLIPAAVAIVQGYEFSNELLATRTILWINIGLVAVIKFVGMMLANGEDYAPVDKS